MWFVLLPPGVTFNQFNADLLAVVNLVHDETWTNQKADFIGICLWSEICSDKAHFLVIDAKWKQ
jgi:hypothetical protein